MMKNFALILIVNDKTRNTFPLLHYTLFLQNLLLAACPKVLGDSKTQILHQIHTVCGCESFRGKKRKT